MTFNFLSKLYYLRREYLLPLINALGHYVRCFELLAKGYLVLCDINEDHFVERPCSTWIPVALLGFSISEVLFLLLALSPYQEGFSSVFCEP